MSQRDGPTIVMPADFDMMLSASPPNFGLGFRSFHHPINHSGSGGGHHAIGGYHRSRLTNQVQDQQHGRSTTGGGSVSPVPHSKTRAGLHHVHTSSASIHHNHHQHNRRAPHDHDMPQSPLRSILVCRPTNAEQGEDTGAVHPADDDEAAATKPTGGRYLLAVPTTSSRMTKTRSESCLSARQKHVCFADDRGLALVTVKVMSEKSYEPPRIREDILASFTRGATAKAEVENPWEIDFKQPAADYTGFRAKVESLNVSLENVIVKDYQIFGTIKVKNIAFEKRVFLRVTFNDWASHVDVPSVFVPNIATASVFDTFSFDIRIPPNTNPATAIQFCVCFVAGDEEHWDNNDGQNYRLRPVKSAAPQEPDIDFGPALQTTEPSVSWGEFAAWHEVDTTSPYW